MNRLISSCRFTVENWVNERLVITPGVRFGGYMSQRWVSIDKAAYRSLYGSWSHGCIQRELERGRIRNHGAHSRPLRIRLLNISPLPATDARVGGSHRVHMHTRVHLHAGSVTVIKRRQDASISWAHG